MEPRNTLRWPLWHKVKKEIIGSKTEPLVLSWNPHVLPGITTERTHPNTECVLLARSPSENRGKNLKEENECSHNI